MGNVKYQLIEYVAFEKPYLCQYVNLSNIDFMLSCNTPLKDFTLSFSNPFDFLGACTVIRLEVLTMIDCVMLESFVLSFSELLALQQSE